MSRLSIKVTDQTKADQISLVVDYINRGLARGPVIVSLGRETRTLEQNRLLWPLRQDVSAQVQWYGERLTREEWKDVFSAALKRHRAVPGIDGGIVMVGLHTSRLNKTDFSDLIEIIYSFGAERGVRWSDPALKVYEEYRQ